MPKTWFESTSVCSYDLPSQATIQRYATIRHSVICDFTAMLPTEVCQK